MFLYFPNIFTLFFHEVFRDFSFLVNFAKSKFADFKGYALRKGVKSLKTYKNDQKNDFVFSK